MQRSFWFKTRYFPLIGLGLLLGLVAVACGSAAEPQIVEPQIVEKEVIVVATPAPVPLPEGGFMLVDKFTIMITSQGNELFNSKYDSAENNLYQRLAQVWLVGGAFKDGTLVLDPTAGASSAWKIVDDGNGWEFTIRKGIKFHDGSELTVEDVAFKWGWSFNDENGGVSTVRMAREMTNMEVTGPDTIRFTFGKPLGFFATAMSEIDNPSEGTVYSKAHWLSQPKGVDVENCTPTAVCQQAEGFESNPGPGMAGAYDLLHHLPAEEFLFERFEDYFALDQRPYPFKQVSLRLVPEVSTRVAALRAGAADLIEADSTVVNQIEKAGAQIIYAEESVHIWINVNGCDREVDNDGLPIMCNDLRVRQALDYAIDKTKIQALYGGPESFLIAGMHGIGSPSGLGYEDDLVPFPYDADKARQLMADAGWAGGEGFNGGRKFLINTWTGAGAPLTVEVSTLICQMWNKELGIDCEVNVGEEVSMKKTQYAGEIAGQYLVRTNENTIDGGRRMFGRYAKEGAYIAFDPDLAGPIITAIQSTGTQAERHDLYHTALKAIHDKHFDFTPGFLNAPYGAGERVVSWDPWPLAPYPSALWTVNIK